MYIEDINIAPRFTWSFAWSKFSLFTLLEPDYLGFMSGTGYERNIKRFPPFSV